MSEKKEIIWTQKQFLCPSQIKKYNHVACNTEKKQDVVVHYTWLYVFDICKFTEMFMIYKPLS